ncbi:MAG: tRNA (N6-threonylcarbamoyladenosine(37)-N6)-methyltransferase TrmO, partial [Oscillospiraceae bacterium]|nr:tRNA (N6-threonylcarbamoyladenosine(37)-N6)-methyltransferase TrmO [Oscillospiraceae bacterium]
MAEHIIRPIAHVRSDFTTKFGIPRQAGIVPELESILVFEPEYRDVEALRGIEGFSHLWLIWQFSENLREGFSPTVRPPRLGGNERLGVFATRSPFRPNALGLSCVQLVGLEQMEGLGTVLRLRGADLMDGTPVYDVKPYVPYADCHPDALSGFAADSGKTLEVEFMDGCEAKVPAGKLAALRGVLANDPRPRYQKDPERVYAMDFAGMEIKFSVSGEKLLVR